MPRRQQNSIPYAVSFNGSSSYAATPSVDMASARKMTIIFDMILLKRNASSVPVELSTNYTANNAFAVLLTAQGLQFSVHGNTGGLYSTVTVADGELPIGRKFRVVCSWDGTQASGQTRVCINGQDKSSAWASDQNVVDSIGSAAMYFGARGGASLFAEYQISECIIITGKSFTTEESLREYQYGEIPALVSGQAKKLHLMADTGKAIWKDYSGNAYDATITNAAQTRGRDARRKRFPVRPTLADIIAIPGISVFHASYGITKDGSDKVSRWDEVSGNGFYLSQATGANQPTWLASAVNSLPAVRLSNSANSYMTGTNAFEGGNQPNSLFCVAKPHTSIPAAFCGFMCIGTGGAGGNTSSIGTNNVQKLWFGGAGDGSLDFFVPTVGETYYLGKVHNGRCVDVFVNGRFISTQGALTNSNISPATSMALGLYTAGTSQPNVDIPFAVFAYRALDMAETQAIYRYAKSEFGTALARQTASARQTADIYGATAASASGTITVTDYQYLAGKNGTATMTISDYSLMAGGALNLLGFATLTEGVDFDAETSNDVTASNLVTAINAAIGDPVSAAVGAVITFTVPGSVTGSSITWTGSGVTPSVATIVDGFSVSQLTFESVYTSFGTSPGYIDPGASNSDCATAIADWINAQTSDVTASAVGSVVTITADAAGTAGNAINMSIGPQGGSGTISGGVTLSGATLSGGVDGSTSRHRSLAT